MFVHISPESDALGETISTLKFAERVATVELGAARVNKDSAEVKELKEQVLTYPELFILYYIIEFFSFRFVKRNALFSFYFILLCLNAGLVCFQIASLKAALGRKDAETDSSQHSRSSTPERGRMKPAGTSQHSWHSTGNISNSRKQLLEDVGNVEVSEYYMVAMIGF